MDNGKMTIGGKMLKAPTAGAFLNLWSTKGQGTLLPPPPTPSLTACLAIISLLHPWNLPTFSNGLPVPVHTSEKRDYFWEQSVLLKMNT